MLRGKFADGAMLAVLVGLAALSALALAAQAVESRPMHAAGMTIDRLGASLSLLVATVGAATFRFSLRYLDGDPRRAAVPAEALRSRSSRRTC